LLVGFTQALRSNDPQSIEETLRVLDEEANELMFFLLEKRG